MRYYNLFGILILIIMLPACRSSYCGRCDIIGENDFDKQFIDENPRLIKKLVPDLREIYGDTVFLEVKPVFFDSTRKDYVIYKFRFRYKFQKTIKWMDTNHSTYQYFFIEKNKIIPFWKMSQNQKHNFLKRRYKNLSFIYGKERIDELYRVWF